MNHSTVEEMKSKKDKKLSVESSSSFEKDFKGFFKRNPNSSPEKEPKVKKPGKLVGFLQPSKYKREKGNDTNFSISRNSNSNPSRLRDSSGPEVNQSVHAITAKIISESTQPQSQVDERRHSFSSIYTIQHPVEQKSWTNSVQNAFKRKSSKNKSIDSTDHYNERFDSLSIHSDITRNEEVNEHTRASAQTDIKHHFNYNEARNSLQTNSDNAYSAYPRSSTSSRSEEPIKIKKSISKPHLNSYFDSPETHEKIQAILEVLTDTDYVNVDGTETTPHDVYITMLDRLDSIWAERMIGFSLAH